MTAERAASEAATPAAVRTDRPVVVFLAFAYAYFFAALLRAVVATLAPVFSAELGLRAADLGLLAGAFFLGFAAVQLPLGQSLDRTGPRRTLLAMLALAVAGSAAFSAAQTLPALVAARALMGAGLGACLMAALTCYRRLLSPPAQLRANSWMLMTGSLGMVASTLPVQWLLPLLGWRGLIAGVAVLLVVAMAGIAALVPRDALVAGAGRAPAASGYAAIARHPLFRRMAPLGFFLYGGLIAVQSLWAGPWLTQVAGRTPAQAAQGLFAINLSMLFTFMAWGAVMPWLNRHGVSALRLVRWGVPVPALLLFVNVAAGPVAGALQWALWCTTATFVSVSQPAIGAAFAPAQAGRALSAFNLVIFAGVFCVQWGIGLLIDLLRQGGVGEAEAFRAAFGVFGGCVVLSYVWFVQGGRRLVDNPA